MLYQQLYIYFIPMFTNLGFINAFTVAIRLYWFRKHLSKVGTRILHLFLCLHFLCVCA